MAVHKNQSWNEKSQQEIYEIEKIEEKVKESDQNGKMGEKNSSVEPDHAIYVRLKELTFSFGFVADTIFCLHFF